jgi:proteasome lid subunit RPN8/RPN11
MGEGEERAGGPKIHLGPAGEPGERRIRLQAAPDRFTRKEEMPWNRNPEVLGIPRDDALPLFLEDTTFSKIIDYLGADASEERSGFLLGHYCVNEAEERFIRVVDFVENIAGVKERVQVTIRTDDMKRAHEEAKKRDLQIVGWVHSHPDMPTAPTNPPDSAKASDTFIMRSFFRNEENVTLIVDPVRKGVGRFRLKNGEPFNEGGFYLVGDKHKSGIGTGFIYTTANYFGDLEGEEYNIRLPEEREGPGIRLGKPGKPPSPIEISERRIRWGRFLRKINAFREFIRNL